MSMLLLIRSADDVRSDVEAANELLVYRRQRFAGANEADEAIGVWLRRELDLDLQGEGGLGIRESFSRSGVWALCWIDDTLLSSAHGAIERRRTVLDSLLKRASRARCSSASETFFPVFAAADTVESVKSTLSELKDRYPQIIGKTWFIHDRERGIVPAQ